METKIRFFDNFYNKRFRLFCKYLKYLHWVKYSQMWKCLNLTKWAFFYYKNWRLCLYKEKYYIFIDILKNHFLEEKTFKVIEKLIWKDLWKLD